MDVQAAAWVGDRPRGRCAFHIATPIGKFSVRVEQPPGIGELRPAKLWHGRAGLQFKAVAVGAHADASLGYLPVLVPALVEHGVGVVDVNKHSVPNTQAA